MIEAVIILAAVNGVLALSLVVENRWHANERAEWVKERRWLVNRVVARHTGEAIALDREAEPKLSKRNDDGKPPIFVEGLS